MKSTKTVVKITKKAYANLLPESNGNSKKYLLGARKGVIVEVIGLVKNGGCDASARIDRNTVSAAYLKLHEQNLTGSYIANVYRTYSDSWGDGRDGYIRRSVSKGIFKVI